MRLISAHAAKSTFAIAALGALALVAPSGPSGAVSPVAKICKSWISGTGKGPTIVHARHFARGDWMTKAKAAYGASYANLSLAQVGAFPCNHAQGQVFCTIRAKPCTRVPLTTKSKAK